MSEEQSAFKTPILLVTLFNVSIVGIILNEGLGQ